MTMMSVNSNYTSSYCSHIFWISIKNRNSTRNNISYNWDNICGDPTLKNEVLVQLSRIHGSTDTRNKLKYLAYDKILLLMPPVFTGFLFISFTVNSR